MNEVGEMSFYNFVIFLEMIYEGIFGGDFDSLIEMLALIYQSYSIVATGAALLFLTGIVYSQVRIFQLKKEEEEALMALTEEEEHIVVDEVGGEADKPGRLKWQTVLRHAGSENSNDWRLAILEADIMLDTLSRERGWIGENLGERLKSVSRGNFQTIDKAWEAHRMRNAIAHEGGDFQLSERDAKRTIALFREVFEEFDYI